ncbi:MAG: dipeptide epimerase [Proteobacteria bacterium]|nr:dipeptide epimerase [Pseudomonadota bacterium]MBI3498598.1 dipeptide epimerase [Pseudomonadota bacterium]
MSQATLTVRREVFPIRAGGFSTSREAAAAKPRTEAEVVTAEISEGGFTGRGECVPYKRYGESMDSVVTQIESVRALVESGGGRAKLQAALPHGAARNAVDCAYWDLEAKRAGKRAWALAGLPEPKSVVTCYTLSVDTAAKMGEAARASATRPLLKLKLTGEGDLERVRAIRVGAPGARLVVDANEAWTIEQYQGYAPELAKLGVELIEQPLPAGKDGDLARVPHPVPVCADESCHDRASLSQLKGRYEAINLKLDKTGGLTEALALLDAARAAGFEIMVGCMVGTSLAMAPGVLVAQGARWVDLDGPLILARDREPGLKFEGSIVHPPEPALWG